jgi:hypothetical protein
MGDESIELWLNKYQYTALSDILYENGTDIKAVMQEKLVELYIQTVPKQERIEIENRINAERLAAEQRSQEIRRFSVYHVTENGNSHCFESDYCLELMQLALLVRRYQRSELKYQPESFTALFRNSVSINALQFEENVKKRMDNTGQITGVFDIDFDRKMISGVNIMDGWKAYSMKDTGTAAYYAYRTNYLPEDKRWPIFLEHLEGRELTQPAPLITAGCHKLEEGDISFSDEIMETDGRLNFYINVPLNVDEIFGTHVETANNDDWINVYANYDTVHGQVCDTLDIVLNRGDGSCEELAYQLDDHEKKLLLSKMQDYCMKQEGMTLEDYSLQLQEESEPLTGPSNQQM